jgi:L-lactate utilization protein LutC
MPAIHMTKEEVTEVFNTKVEQGQSPDISKLVKFARAKLRAKFLSADMGITGANIAVAETGSLVIVTPREMRGWSLRCRRFTSPSSAWKSWWRSSSRSRRS